MRTEGSAALPYTADISPSRNFSTTGRRPFLYFTRLYYKRCYQTYNRDLVRRRVAFRR